MADGAVYRGTSMKNKVASLLEAEDDFKRPVLDKLGQAYVDEVEAMSPFAWIDIDYDVRLSRILVEEHGPAGGRRISRECVARNFRGTLFGPMVKGALRIFGNDPGKCMTWVPKGWSQMFRNAGEVMVANDSDAGVCCLTFMEAPAAFFEKGYADGLAGGFEVFFEVTQKDDTIDIGLIELSECFSNIICCVSATGITKITIKLRDVNITKFFVITAVFDHGMFGIGFFNDNHISDNRNNRSLSVYMLNH